MHTPGHTGDSICLWHPSSRTLLCADTVLGWGSTTVADLGDYMKSLDELLALEPQPLALLPGHGPPILPSHQQQGVTPHSHIQQYKDHRNARILQVLQYLKDCHISIYILKYHALPTLHLLQVLAAVKKLSAQGSAVVQLTTRLVTEEVRPLFCLELPRCSPSRFPGLPWPRHVAARGRRRQHSAGKHLSIAGDCP